MTAEVQTEVLLQPGLTAISKGKKHLTLKIFSLDHIGNFLKSDVFHNESNEFIPVAHILCHTHAVDHHIKLVTEASAIVVKTQKRDIVYREDVVKEAGFSCNPIILLWGITGGSEKGKGTLTFTTDK